MVIGLAAAGRDPSRGGRRGVDYLIRNIGRVTGIGDVERAILALRAAHRSVRKVGGRDLVVELVRERRGTGSFAGLVNQTAFAILALRAAGRSAKDRTIRAAAGWLAGQHNADGGFNFAGRGGPSDIDDAAAAVQGLVAAGKRGTARWRAPRRSPRARTPTAACRCRRAARPTRGRPRGRSRRSSPPVAIRRACAAAARARRWPTSARCTAPSGAVRYSRTSSQSRVWVTAQALTGLARSPFPIR